MCQLGPGQEDRRPKGDPGHREVGEPLLCSGSPIPVTHKMSMDVLISPLCCGPLGLPEAPAWLTVDVESITEQMKFPFVEA